MGNDVKSRLHLKKGDHKSNKHDAEANQSGGGTTEVDQNIMKAPSRAREADVNPSSGSSAPTTSRGAEPAPTRGDPAPTRNQAAQPATRS